MTEKELTDRLDAWLDRVDGYWYLDSEFGGEPRLKRSLLRALMGKPIRTESGITEKKRKAKR